MSQQTNNQAREKAKELLAKILVESTPAKSKQGLRRKSAKKRKKPLRFQQAVQKVMEEKQSKKLTTSRGIKKKSSESKKKTSEPRPAPKSSPTSAPRPAPRPTVYTTRVLAKSQYETGRPLPFLNENLNSSPEYAEVAPLTDEQIRRQEGLRMRELKPAPTNHSRARGVMKWWERARAGIRKQTDREIKAAAKKRIDYFNKFGKYPEPEGRKRKGSKKGKKKGKKRTKRN